MTDYYILKIAGLLILFLSIILHEIAHGVAALLCGDDTAKRAGRITLNPIKHIDLIGTIVVPLIMFVFGLGVMFGWAKPVPVNIYRCKNPHNALWITAIAGPLTNVALAAIFYVLVHVLFNLGLDSFVNICVSGLIINVVLAVFNLIPIPPLDGSRIVLSFLPRELMPAYMKLEKVGLIILAILMYTGIFSSLIEGVVNGILKTL